MITDVHDDTNCSDADGSDNDDDSDDADHGQILGMCHYFVGTCLMIRKFGLPRKCPLAEGCLMGGTVRYEHKKT